MGAVINEKFFKSGCGARAALSSFLWDGAEAVPKRRIRLQLKTKYGIYINTLN